VQLDPVSDTVAEAFLDRHTVHGRFVETSACRGKQQQRAPPLVVWR
jgi:hypothetical protein